MRVKLLFIFLISILQFELSQAQLSRHDTIQYLGKKDYKSGDLKTHWVSRIILCPDSTYKKGDYYYTTDKSKKNWSNITPVVDTGYWVLKNKNIYFYAFKDFIGPEFKAKYKVRTNSILYEWKSVNKKVKKTRNKSHETFDKIYGIKPITKFYKLKTTG